MIMRPHSAGSSSDCMRSLRLGRYHLQRYASLVTLAFAPTSVNCANKTSYEYDKKRIRVRVEASLVSITVDMDRAKRLFGDVRV